MVSDKTGVPEGLPEPPGEVMGHIGPRGEREGCARRWRAPPHEESELDKEGGTRPLSLSLSLSFPSPFPNPSWTRKGESYSHWEEDSPSLGAPLSGRPASPCLLYIRGQGAPQATQVDP